MKFFLIDSSVNSPQKSFTMLQNFVSKFNIEVGEVLNLVVATKYTETFLKCT